MCFMTPASNLAFDGKKSRPRRSLELADLPVEPLTYDENLNLIKESK